ncbi:hypothetical protein O6H91_14G056200 [Diphasiastrum complanatum]|uniref:Uncharacterized protein n=1 Tax=Diphasiastrum complanatum TaxID=34168 RepID=A0ACC2BQE3_DIPCM|nr:hypothetical protein O6H91_14G056200 [Diphasiastrum complanatum]
MGLGTRPRELPRVALGSGRLVRTGCAHQGHRPRSASEPRATDGSSRYSRRGDEPGPGAPCCAGNARAMATEPPRSGAAGPSARGNLDMAPVRVPDEGGAIRHRDPARARFPVGRSSLAGPKAPVEPAPAPGLAPEKRWQQPGLLQLSGGRQPESCKWLCAKYKKRERPVKVPVGLHHQWNVSVGRSSGKERDDTRTITTLR